MSNNIESAYLLTSSKATHKARLATGVLGIPVRIAHVIRNEPNQLWDTTGLVIQKYSDFAAVWHQPESYQVGRCIAGSADVNVGHQIQGDTSYIPSRKVKVVGKNPKQRINTLAGRVSGMARVMGEESTIVSRVEAGASFTRRFSNKNIARLTTVARTHITQPGNPMANKELLGDYYQWSGLGEMHEYMPWGIDWLSWVAFLVCQNQTHGMKASEMVRLPKSMSCANYDHRGLEVFHKLDRLNDEWLEFVEPHIALALLQFGSNFPQPFGEVIYGGLSKPGNNDRIVYVH